MIIRVLEANAQMVFQLQVYYVCTYMFENTKL